jgi:uncharacterized membrane protein YdjX (TVP38/TMEM64 family)
MVWMADLRPLSWTRHRLVWRFLPWLVLAAGFVGFFAVGLHRYISLDTLRQHRNALHAWVDTHAVLAPLVFTGIYRLFVVLSLPGAEVLSIAGGLLFGDYLRTKAGPWLHRIEAGCQDNTLSYMLLLRLIPFVPFFIVSLVPAFLRVPWQTYALGTFIGIIPVRFVYASVGAGLDSLFAAGVNSVRRTS